jgi:hypothetical protein
MQNFVAIGASLHAAPVAVAGPGRRRAAAPPPGTVPSMRTYRWTILAMVIGAAVLTLVVVLLFV